MTQDGSAAGGRGYKIIHVAIAFAFGLAAGLIVTWYSHTRSARPEHVVDAFHNLFYDASSIWAEHTDWLGVNVEKAPMDLWAYQQLLWDQKPDVLLEMGTYHGGSAYYFATLFDLMNHGRVITVDIKKWGSPPVHPRITYLLGSSVSPEIVAQIRNLVKPGEKIMVVLDSDHHRDHVLKELTTYAEFVTPGCYMVVEDTNINGHPVNRAFGPGPAEATEDFLKTNDGFKPDPNYERFLVSFNPGGWLKRIK
jgi:cephalosporin hydroxylase